MNTDRQKNCGDSLQVDAARKRRLMDKTNRVAYEAEWMDFLRECRDEVEAYCRRLKHSPEDTAEIQHLVVQRLPSIVERFDPDRGSGAGFRTFLHKPIEFAIKDYFGSAAPRWRPAIPLSPTDLSCQRDVKDLTCGGYAADEMTTDYSLDSDTATNRQNTKPNECS